MFKKMHIHVIDLLFDQSRTSLLSLFVLLSRKKFFVLNQDLEEATSCDETMAVVYHQV